MLERLKGKLHGDKTQAPEVFQTTPEIQSPDKELTSSYHQTKQIIEQARLDYIEETGNDSLPQISFYREKDSSRIRFELPQNTDMFSLLAKVSESIGDMELSSYSSLSESFLCSKDNLRIWLRRPSTFSHGSVEFSKNSDLKAQEIEALIGAYKFAHNHKPEKAHDPRKELESLGATVFDPEGAPNWDYLAGYENVKERVKDNIILVLEHPEIYEQIAKKTRKVYESNRPKAVLFEGPPGTGKTTMARVIAGKVNVPLVYVPIESIMSKWYGESENNLASIFSECGQLGNALLFLDEIDSLATTRERGIHEETRRVLSVLLRNIDGFNPNQKTILIGATNRKNDLDAALLSRFDTCLEFPLPDLDERLAIFANYATHLNNQELSILAQKGEGMSGRDIKNLCERVERRWASKIITQEVEETSTPSLSDYLAWTNK